jgi:antitoxin (DNA-binding transcriptional repressor) of toxin-antitoxin stability system
MTKTVPQAEFAENALALLDEVAQGDDIVLVTRDGHVIAQLVSMRGPMAGRGRTIGDIVSPLDDEWDAMK